jgi:hypothetical protein
MALAATGSESASAATVPDSSTCHYRVEAKLVSGSVASADEVAMTLPSVVVLNHVLGLIAVSHAIGLPSGNLGESSINPKVRPDARDGFEFSFVHCEISPDKQSPKHALHAQRLNPSIEQTSDRFHTCSLSNCTKSLADYAADSRLMASTADANERQLLFVKITKG